MIALTSSGRWALARPSTPLSYPTRVGWAATAVQGEGLKVKTRGSSLEPSFFRTVSDLLGAVADRSNVPFNLRGFLAVERRNPVDIRIGLCEEVRGQRISSSLNDLGWDATVARASLLESVDVEVDIGVQLRKLGILEDNALVVWRFEPILSTLFMRERSLNNPYPQDILTIDRTIRLSFLIS